MRALRLFAFLFVAAASLAQASEPVPDYGKISPVAGASNLPDRQLQYRVIFSVTKASEKPANASASLEKVARFLNLLGSQGIPRRKQDVIVILHGQATTAVLEDNAYRSRYGVPNPNLPLIRALRKAGATVHVCGQALAAQKIDPAALAADVIIDLSAMTTIATLQLRGWVLLPE